ncbi:MAG: DNA-directed RNA polymerase subunit L [Candidatus Micrarchaeota archaeon]
MKLNVKKLEKNYLEIVLEGEDVSLADSLREMLVDDSDVEFVAARLEHPQVGHPILILRTKSKDALTLLIGAVEQLKDRAEEFKSALKAAKKTK